MDSNLLLCLNPAQLKAVQHPPDVPLQILAGPGSGKTKVLTCRIAFLILNFNHPPSSICAVTFTNKAANEMRERLTKLIGKQKTEEVRMGTFHALCAQFLRKYASEIGLEGNFTVCDAEESKKIISKLLKPYKDALAAKDIVLKEATVLSLISKAKAKGTSAEEMTTNLSHRQRHLPTKDIDHIFAEIYGEYQRTLRKSNCLDFDDLLMFGVKLFERHKKTVNWCRHVLVDEFQDTNTTQYQLMQHLAATHRCVTIVGDPDQSIYGWRSAEIENLSKMRRNFLKTKQIFLEENYRSTGSILAASLSIVAQDKSRIKKTLYTSHPAGYLPVLRSFQTEHAEAAFIAVEIKRLVAYMGGMLGWGDFVILLRFNALSRAIESALQMEGIPSRVLGGHKFFERLEIKDLLAYLQLVDNPQFLPAFSRAVNVPSRGIGEKTLSEIMTRAEKTNLSPLEVVERIYDSNIPDTKPPVKRKLSSFVKTIRTLRDLAERTSPADLIRRLLELTQYGDHLRKTQPDWESRWENVQELINFASEADCNTADGTNSESRDTQLRLFLEASMLFSDGDKKKEAADNEKVTISTCHAAKGLEWPVVMIPAVEKGIFPFYRSDDVEEERRLLYVACTRAQGLLYLSHVTHRKAGGDTSKRDLSEFVSSVAKEKPTIFTNSLPEFSAAARGLMASVLDRTIPKDSEVTAKIAGFTRAARVHSQNAEQSISMPWQNRLQVPVPPGPPSFQSSSSVMSRFPQPLHCQTSSSIQPLSPTRTLILNTTTKSQHNSWMHPHGRNMQNASQSGQTNDAQQRSPQETRNGSTVFTNYAAPTPQLCVSDVPEPTQFPGAINTTRGKRRLGMGRATAGYSNKKFKTHG